MAGNAVKLEFAGDAKKLATASKQAQGALDDVEKATKGLTDQGEKASKSSGAFTDKIGKLGAGAMGISGAFDDAGAAIGALVDLQNAGREKAARYARAAADVEQAMLDQKQATIDLEQATIDLGQAETDGKQAKLDFKQAQIDQTQALLDAKTAQEEYNKEVKKHGKGSTEAKQALIDLRQAQQDASQASLDMDQASSDLAQSQNDAKQATLDATQAVRDGKDAQLNLNDAMHEANPSGLQQWADKIQMITPLLSGLVGVVALVTAAQWAWNAAQAASPLTWLLLAIGAVVAIIVVIAVKTKWFKQLWGWAWGGIKQAAANVGNWFKDVLWGRVIKPSWDGILGAGMKVWNWMHSLPGKLKSAFVRVTDFLSAPFRAAFNLVASAWNNTIGRLSWSVPGWVPFIGGNTISAPRLPHFHSGVDSVPGPPGSEMLAVLQAGERVIPASQNRGGDMTHVVVKIDRDTLLDVLAKGNRRGGLRYA